MLISVLSPAFRTDTVSCPVLVGSVFDFMVFQSLGQNISQFISEFVIITHFTFWHEGPRKFQDWKLS